MPKGLRMNLVVLAAVALVSCESGQGQADMSGQPQDLSADSSDFTEADWRGGETIGPLDRIETDGSGTYDMTGTWAEWEVGASVTQVPVLGEARTLGVAIMRWEVVQTGQNLTMRQELCDLTLVSDTDLATTIVPDSFINSVPIMDKTGTVQDQEGTYRFTMDLTPELYGVVLSDPLNEALPTSADDSRLFDQDGDGHPGMTVFITGVLDGAAYLAQRNLRALDGTFVGTDRIEGLMDWTQDQNVIDSDNEILASNPPTSKTDPDPQRSRFVAVRIPPNRDCAWLLANQKELFPQP